MKFTNRTVLVTGGAHGIGRAIADAFLQEGAIAIILDKDEMTGQAYVQECQTKGLPAFFYPIDLTFADEVCQLFRQISEKYHPDILVNNAGKGYFKPLTELSIDEWDEIINLNLRAAFILSREFAHVNKGTSYGRIINIASTRAIMSEPNSECYAASKGGIVALTHALALSLSSEKITVNCISPGWIHTREDEILREDDHLQHPSGRVGQPADIARACLFLADEQNDFINGQNFIIDGGMTRKMIYNE